VDQNGDFSDHIWLQHLQILSARRVDAPQNHIIGPRQFALLLVSIGLISLLLATLEHRRYIRALEAEYAGQQRSLAVLVAALISILGIVAFIAMVFRQ
jgi:putative membrane protein